MPTLNKPVKQRVKTINRAERLKVYLSEKWKKLRLAKLMANPLCEVCLEKGITKLAIDVHHLDSFMNYSDNVRLYKAYDFGNLLSVCKECHAKLHSNSSTA